MNPVYNLSETVSICSGESYTFPDGTTQDDITATILHASNLVTIDDCDSIITTTVNVNPVYNLSESVELCSGESYTFPDGTTQEDIISSVSYSSNLITIDGCDSIIITNIDIASVDISLSQTGATLIANAVGADYQWIDCDNMNSEKSGETSQSFTALQSGNFAVIITENGCSDTSDCYNVIVSGIEESLFEKNIVLYPNPVTDVASIILPDYYSEVHIAVFNMQGQMVLDQLQETEQNSLQLDLNELDPGIYLIYIYANTESAVLRIIKD